MNIDSSRLTRIEARARALGWGFGTYDLNGIELVLGNNDPQNKWSLRMDNTPECIKAAERLLTAYEPVTGPVVEIRHKYNPNDSQEPISCSPCQMTRGGRLDMICELGFDNDHEAPDPDKCPGPGTYRLTRCATRRIVMSDQHDWIFTCPFCKKDTRTNANPDIPGSVLCYHCNKKLMVMDLEKRPVPAPAPYPLEQYAAAAEDLGNQPLTPYEVGDPLQYAQSLNWEKGWRAAALTFAQMLRGTPTSLYTNWPAYFPDPCAGDYDPNQFRVYDNLPQELSDKQDELLKEIGSDPGAGDKETVTGPVVVIRRATDASGDFCNTNCDLSSRTLCLHCSGHVISGPHRPKETCPGPAPVGKEWRMVLCDAPDPGAGGGVNSRMVKEQ